MWSDLRQRRFPKEFRIARAEFPRAALAQLIARASADAAVLQAEGSASKPPTPAADEPPRYMAELGTGLWRLRQRMVEPGTSRPLSEMKRAYRHFESIWDVITQAGLEIQDHTDTPFDAGMSLKVIAFQPTAGLAREKVIETIKPSIYFHGRPIQMGEVIVGTPEQQGAC
jgi:hypothetical protein